MEAILPFHGRQDGRILGCARFFGKIPKPLWARMIFHENRLRRRPCSAGKGTP
ncbi:hypothetical protein [Prevotella sp. HUN102]|uniref:hypothetical protein n=1 Tax=Prevotella sp. HUN102 TaxID=1392486 RepID=UPI0012DD545B|nr:hypothetical protein [Prevotella sp. HUN102]